MFTKGSNDYVKLRLRLNSASILAKYRKKCRNISNFMGNIYDIRSEAVHGSNLTPKFESFIRNRYCVKEDDIISVVIKFRKELISYLNSSLLFLVKEIIKNSSIFEKLNEDPIYFFNNCKFSANKKNKTKILKELKQRYKREQYTYETKWEEICALFDVEDIS